MDHKQHKWPHACPKGTTNLLLACAVSDLSINHALPRLLLRDALLAPDLDHSRHLPSLSQFHRTISLSGLPIFVRKYLVHSFGLHKVANSSFAQSPLQCCRLRKVQILLKVDRHCLMKTSLAESPATSRSDSS